ncbi:hypothetical protein MKW92_023267 [Papaver armeniacum]|nr:hypothetical protein MKW92_023267 [Papaver armeniacum]
MQLLFGSICFFSILFAFLFFALLPSFLFAVTEEEASLIVRRQLLTFPENGALPDNVEYEIDIKETFANRRLHRAYIGLQAWKKVMYSDPFNTTGNWVGPDVCAYTGCLLFTRALDNPRYERRSLVLILMGRHCWLPPEQQFVGPFPKVVLSIPALKYLDLRFNDFEGKLPPELFNKDLDGLFLNDNRFRPRRICEIRCGLNSFVGDMNNRFCPMKLLEILDLSGNSLTGLVPEKVCKLPKLENFTFSDNFFNEESHLCVPSSNSNTYFDDSSNCFPVRPKQKTTKVCTSVVNNPVDCIKSNCVASPLSSKNISPPDTTKTPTPTSTPLSPKPQPQPQPTPRSQPRPSPQPQPTPSPTDAPQQSNTSPSSNKRSSPTFESKPVVVPIPSKKPPSPSPKDKSPSQEMQSPHVHSPPPLIPTPKSKSSIESMRPPYVHSLPPPVRSPIPPPPVHFSTPPIIHSSSRKSPVQEKRSTPLNSPPLVTMPKGKSPVEKMRSPHVYSPPSPVYSPPPPVHSPPPHIHSPPPPVHSPPPPVHSPPPPVNSPPPPVYSPPPPVHPPPPPIAHSPPPPASSPPPPPMSSPPPTPLPDVILPPNLGFAYLSPPPPVFPGY